jgi:signal transduction histidine kinase
MKIRTRLFLAFLLIITMSMTITGLMSYRVIRAQILDETKAELFGAGEELLPLLKRASPQEARQMHRFREAVLVRAGNIDSIVIVADKEGTILVSNSPVFEQSQEVPPGLLSGKGDQEVNTGTDRYLAITLPWHQDPSGELEGFLYILADISDIQAVSRRFFSAQLGGYLIMMLVATVATALVATSLTRPIIKLQRHAQGIRPGSYNAPVQVRTGDEIENLADTINDLDRRLQDYDHLQRRLLQNISHELKSPLMSVQGYAEGIKDGIFTGTEADNGLETIIGECQRLKKLVDEVIFLSQLETMTDLFHLQPEPLNEIIRSAVEKSRGMAVKADINISLDFQEDMLVDADANRLKQALINLLSNCIRHGKTKIVITAASANGNAVLSIRDDGGGFSQQDLKNLFKRLYKGDQGSTGLGLAIAKAIVEKHSGTIRADNHPQGGAEYLVLLPLKCSGCSKC